VTSKPLTSKPLKNEIVAMVKDVPEYENDPSEYPPVICGVVPPLKLKPLESRTVYAGPPLKPWSESSMVEILWRRISNCRRVDAQSKVNVRAPLVGPDKTGSTDISALPEVPTGIL
jgi:hypothetical protein